MKNKLILIMTVPVEHVRQKRDVLTDPMLALGYLAASLRKAGHAVALFDPKYEGCTFEQSIEHVRTVAPRVVGLSSMTHEISRAHYFAEEIKKILPSMMIIVGGAHPTSLPVETMQEFPAFDMLIKGEGEETIVEIAETMSRDSCDFSHIKGIVLRNAEELHETHSRDWIASLDSLPVPAWDLYPTVRRTAFPVLASRGCPFQCLFCMRVLGSHQRRRSPQNVAHEMEWLVLNFNPTEINFEDETFGLDKEWAKELCDEIQKRGLEKRVKWTAHVRANTAPRDFLEMIKKSGCYSVGLGVESGNAEIIKNIQKGISLEQVVRVVNDCREIGLIVRTFFILGHPHETTATALETIRFAAALKPHYAVFGIMVPYPKTAIALMAEKGEGGYHLRSLDWTAYDKHLGNALELKNIRRRKLELLQLWAYVYFYIANGRFLDFLRFAWTQQQAAFSLLKKVLGLTS